MNDIANADQATNPLAAHQAAATHAVRLAALLPADEIRGHFNRNDGSPTNRWALVTLYANSCEHADLAATLNPSPWAMKMLNWAVRALAGMVERSGTVHLAHIDALVEDAAREEAMLAAVTPDRPLTGIFSTPWLPNV
jgi:hypothetical protein